MKQLTVKMAASGLSAQSLINFTKVVKMVVASAVNDEGEQIYPRKWTITSSECHPEKRRATRAHCHARAEIERILTNTGKRWAVLFWREQACGSVKLWV
jgi:hypothetical protein